MSGGEATRGAKPEPHMDMYIFKKISADCEFVLHILLFFSLAKLRVYSILLLSANVINLIANKKMVNKLKLVFCHAQL